MVEEKSHEDLNDQVMKILTSTLISENEEEEETLSKYKTRIDITKNREFVSNVFSFALEEDEREVRSSISGKCEEKICLDPKLEVKIIKRKSKNSLTSLLIQNQPQTTNSKNEELIKRHLQKAALIF